MTEEQQPTDGEPFVFAEQTQLSKDAEASLHPSGKLVVKTRHNQVTLDVDEAWNLLQWLADHQREHLYQLVQRGKPPEQKADISFLEMEDEHGVYRIVGQDEHGRDVKRYLSESEIVMPTVCPYCKQAECICQEPEVLL